MFAGVFLVGFLLAVVHAMETCPQTAGSRIATLDTDKMVKKLIANHDSGAWVQIGANTMDQELADNNPLMNVLDKVPHWNKYFMEPIPHNYERLLENSKRWPNTTTIQAALTGDGGHFEGIGHLYCLEGYTQKAHAHHLSKHTQQTHSADELCSFDKKHVIKHFPKGTVVDVAVTRMSVSVFLMMYGIEDIRMLVLDTEGFDAAVLQVFPLSTTRPPVIVYEHIHLLKEDKKKLDNFLMDHCYVLYQEQVNTFAVQKDFYSQLLLQ